MFPATGGEIIAIEKNKPATDIFKKFKASDETDVIKMSSVYYANIEMETMVSQNLYKNFYKYLDENLEDYQSRNLKDLINEFGHIKIFYIIPKELSKLQPTSILSTYSLRDKSVISYLGNENNIIILIQGIEPVMGSDKELFKTILQSILRNTMEYVFKNRDILDVIENPIFNKYDDLSVMWYENFIRTTIEKYNLHDLTSNYDIVISLAGKLISLIQETYKTKIPKNELIKFFTYDMLLGSHLLKKETIRDSSNDLIQNKLVGESENHSMIKKYLKEITLPITNIFNNNALKPEWILSDSENSSLIEIIKRSYDIILEDKIDPNFLIKDTIFQELYLYHTISINMLKFEDDYDSILKSLCYGEIFDNDVNPSEIKRIFKIKSVRSLCTEISGLTPAMMRSGGGDIEEIILSSEEGSELLLKGFTSPYIKKTVNQQVINSSSKFQCVHNKINDLILNGVITPVMFTDSDSFAILIENSNAYEYEKRIMGFYEHERNQIFLMLNNVSIGASGSIPNNMVMSLIIHELMHYSYQNDKESYLKIFDNQIKTFYKELFDSMFYCDIDEKVIHKYVESLYDFESTANGDNMIEGLNQILDYAEKHTTNEDLGYMNAKGLNKLFIYLGGKVENATGVSIAKLSNMIFREHMIKAYEKSFAKLSPDLYKTIKNRNANISWTSVFYQEFIATSEVAAILAGTLVKELEKNQMALLENNPIARMINSI